MFRPEQQLQWTSPGEIQQREAQKHWSWVHLRAEINLILNKFRRPRRKKKWTTSLLWWSIPQVKNILNNVEAMTAECTQEMQSWKSKDAGNQNWGRHALTPPPHTRAGSYGWAWAISLIPTGDTPESFYVPSWRLHPLVCFQYCRKGHQWDYSASFYGCGWVTTT